MALDRILHGGLPCRSYAEATAARYGVKLRFYASIQDGTGDYEEVAIWATDALDARHRAEEHIGDGYKTWPRRLVGVDARWDAALFPTGEILLRAEFEAWADGVNRMSLAEAVLGVRGKRAAG